VSKTSTVYHILDVICKHFFPCRREATKWQTTSVRTFELLIIVFYFSNRQCKSYTLWWSYKKWQACTTFLKLKQV